MHITTHTNAKEFYSRALPFLLEHEAQNNLIIGVAAKLAEQTAPIDLTDPNAPLLITIEKKQKVIAAGMVTPPHRFVLAYGNEPGTINALCNHLQKTNLPGVMGPYKMAEQFGRHWCSLKSMRLKPCHKMGVYQLTNVTQPNNISGFMAPATLCDIDIILKYRKEFANDVGLHHLPSDDETKTLIESGTCFLWKNPLPVSMAIANSLTPNGIRIGSVYTPPKHRSHGYASALVAILSQKQLDAGRKFCFLFTDLDNPTSNSIYQRIGYQSVSTFAEFDFL